MPQVKVTAVQVRPSTDIDFFESSFNEDINRHIIETYKNTGKLISQEVIYSDDRLTRIGVKLFDSQESREELASDAIFREDNLNRTAYNKQNGITVTVVTEFLS